MAEKRFWRDTLVKQIVFYIEGGRSPSHDINFRQAFHTFFREIEEAAKQKGIGFTTKLCGPRKSAYDQFCYQLRHDTNTLHILLVDSEAPVAERGKVWKHLKQRQGDGWNCPPGVTDAQCHLMAEAMEAWFFADTDALIRFYGPKLNVNALPRRQDVEAIPKDEHLPKLEAATEPTPKKEYHKFRHAPKILEDLDVSKVRARAWHCNRIFETLLGMIADMN